MSVNCYQKASKSASKQLPQVVNTFQNQDSHPKIYKKPVQSKPFCVAVELIAPFSSVSSFALNFWISEQLHLERQT